MPCRLLRPDAEAHSLVVPLQLASPAANCYTAAALALGSRPAPTSRLKACLFPLALQTTQPAMMLARALPLLALLACAAAVTPPGYGCRRTSTTVNVRSAPCPTATRVTTLAPGTYFHFVRRVGSTCGDTRCAAKHEAAPLRAALKHMCARSCVLPPASGSCLCLSTPPRPAPPARRYDWVEVVWNNQKRYLAAGEVGTRVSYARYCPEMGPDPSPYPVSSKAFINSLARWVGAAGRGFTGRRTHSRLTALPPSAGGACPALPSPWHSGSAWRRSQQPRLRAPGAAWCHPADCHPPPPASRTPGAPPP